jgi:hypothetical protein
MWKTNEKTKSKREKKGKREIKNEGGENKENE